MMKLWDMTKKTITITVMLVYQCPTVRWILSGVETVLAHITIHPSVRLISLMQLREIIRAVRSKFVYHSKSSEQASSVSSVDGWVCPKYPHHSYVLQLLMNQRQTAL